MHRLHFEEGGVTLTLVFADAMHALSNFHLRADAFFLDGFAPARNGEGERIWLDLSAGPLGAEEAAVDDYVAKRVVNDPDIWLIEIEDRAGRTFLTEKIDRT